MTILTGFQMAALEQTGIEFLIEVSVKGVLLLCASAIIVRACSGLSAAHRHLVWTVALGSLLALPLLSYGVPRWHVAVSEPIARVTRAPAFLTIDSFTAAVDARESVGASVSISSFLPAPSWRLGLLVTWFAGTVLLLARLFAALVSAMGMVQRTRSIPKGRCTATTRKLARELGLTRTPRVVQGNEHTMPVACGVLRPVILIPETAEQWPLPRLEAVLAHELAHIRRRDILVQVVSQVTCALYWFNPLVWLALRQLRLESERACDDVVLGVGFPATEYADELVTLARSIRRSNAIMLASTPMAEPSQLPSRIRALLEETRDRRGISPAVLVGALGAGAVLCAGIAAATPTRGADRQAAQGVITPSAFEQTQSVRGLPTRASSSLRDARLTQREPVVKTNGVVPPTQVSFADTTRPVVLNPAAVNGAIEQSYPELLRRQGVSGTALLELRIDPRGRVVETRVLSATHPALGEAAARSLSVARFAPARADGEPVPSTVQWPVAFNAISSSATATVHGQLAEMEEALARARRVLEEQHAVVAEQATAVEAQTVAVRAAAEASRAAATPTRAVRALIPAAIAQYHPEVLERGMPDHQYVWFVASPEGEVRQTGVAEKVRPIGMSSDEVRALLSAKFPDLRYEQTTVFAGLPIPGRAGGQMSIAWVVATEPEPR